MRFDFLRGDPSAQSRGRRLPVDAYYPQLNLALEYRETQHAVPVAHFDKPSRPTVSGVHRGRQRRLYDERRRLPAYRIRLVEIGFSDLTYDARRRLRRDRNQDHRTLLQLAVW